MIVQNGTIQISEAEYNQLKQKAETYQRARTELCGNKNSVTELEQRMLPPACTNEELSAIEVYEFKRDVPERYFLYIDEEKKVATTWPGHLLGTVTFGRQYKAPAFGGFGNLRVPVRIHSINGREYHGTYYKDSGSYARVKLCKN